MSTLGPFSTGLHGKIYVTRAALATHAADTAPHSATAAPTASRLIVRDASGRAQVAAPSAGADIATKAYVDGAISSSPSGTVTSVGSGTGLTGGPITGSGTLSLTTTGVAAGSYAYANITVDAQGRITSASTGTPVTVVTGNSGAGLSTSGGTTPQVTQAAATASANGYMSSAYAAKLDGIAAGAQVNTVNSVHGRTGAVVAAFGDYSTLLINGITVSQAAPSGGFDGALWFQVP